MKFTVQRHRLTKRLRPNHRTRDTSLPLTPHHHITKGLFTAVAFAEYIMSGYQEKITRHTKRQTTQFEETEQASELVSDMARMLELSDRELKTTMTIC